MPFPGFTAGGFTIAARPGMFGVRVVLDEEPASWRSDRRARHRRERGCRGRIAEVRAGLRKTPDDRELAGDIDS